VTAEHPQATKVETQRLDKWLFFARLLKSREKAQTLIRDGHVRLNGQRCMLAAHAVKTGDVLTVSLDHQIRVLRVLLSGQRRGPSAEATMLYEELAEPVKVAPQWP
jgi:ribosome-associated heat shock protein Hsp15